MVCVRRSTPGNRRELSIREISRRIRRNRRKQHLPHTLISLDNEIITSTPETIEIDLSTSDDPVTPHIPETEENIEIQEPLDTQIDILASTTPPTVLRLTLSLFNDSAGLVVHGRVRLYLSIFLLGQPAKPAIPWDAERFRIYRKLLLRGAQVDE